MNYNAKTMEIRSNGTMAQRSTDITNSPKQVVKIYFVTKQKSVAYKTPFSFLKKLQTLNGRRR